MSIIKMVCMCSFILVYLLYWIRTAISWTFIKIWNWRNQAVGIFVYIFCNIHLITLYKGKSYKILLFTWKSKTVFSLLPEPCFTCFSLLIFPLHWPNLECTDDSHLPRSSFFPQWKRFQWRSLLPVVDEREVWSWPYLETVWRFCGSGGKSTSKNKFLLMFCDSTKWAGVKGAQNICHSR